MNPQTPKINEAKLSEEQRTQLDKWKHDVKSLQTLEDIATMAQEMLGIMDTNQKDVGRKTLIIDHVTGDDFVKILTNMQDSLQAFKEQKEPELPDYSTPIVAAVSKLDKALSASMKAKGPAPVVNVAAPNVTVEPTPVDLRDIEKILKADLPKAFQEAIKLIPQPDIPEFSNADVVEKLSQALLVLADIDTGVRMKPQPGSMKVTNPDGSKVGSSPVVSGSSILEVPFSTQVVAPVGWTDASMYQWVAVHVVSQGTSSAITFQVSNDDQNWVSRNLTTVSNQGSSAGTVATSSAGIIYEGPISGKYFRLNVTGISAGITAGFIVFHALSPSVTTIGTPALSPRTSGGFTMGRLISAATTNATSLKASAGQVYSYQAFNNGATPAYLKFYNKASAPTVGTDVPVKVILIPGNTAGAGAIGGSSSIGSAFGTGIAYAVTGGMADSDTTAVALSQCAINIDYS